MSDISERIRKELLAKYDANDEAIWQIYGEDPNCDLGGSHSNPLLKTVTGRYGDAVEYALQLSGFFTWGAGGEIRRVTPLKIDQKSAQRRFKLQQERDELRVRLKDIERELQDGL